MSRILSAASAAMLAGAAGLSHSYGTVTIVCHRPGMRRCGVEHPATETYPAERWTDEELARFEADPAFSVRYEQASRSAPGADTADAIQDQGAGAPTPDLGAKPDGTGPSAPVLRADGTLSPALLDASRVDAIRGRLADLAAFMAPAEAAALALADFAALGDEAWAEAEAMLGFRPTPAEMNAAIVSAFFQFGRAREPVFFGIDLGSGPDLHIETEVAAEQSAAPAAGFDDAVVEPSGIALPASEVEASLSGEAAPIGVIDGLTIDHSGVAGPAPGLDRAAAIRAAVATLRAPEDFTVAGKPKLEALEALLGFNIVRADVEATMKAAPAATV